MRYFRGSLRDGPIRLVVNADDLGRTVRINEGIEEAFRHGIVTSTSIVANSPALDDALNVIRRNPLLGVGVHLNLHEYPPLTENIFLQKLAAKSMLKAFASISLATPAQIYLIEKEFRRQILKILSSGVSPTHLDGHCHVHVHPRLVNVLLRLTQDYSIRWIRLPRESLAHWGKFNRYIEKSVLTAVCHFDALLMKHKLYWADEFYGFSEGGNMNQSSLLHILNRMQPGLNELMCHVGTENDDPPFSNGYNWLDEFHAMTAFTKKQLKENYGIQVISYQEVHQ